MPRSRLVPGRSSAVRLFRLLLFRVVGLVQQLVHLALDIRARSNLYVLQYAVSVDGEVVRDGIDAIGPAEGSVRVAVLGPGHVVLLDEGLPCGYVLVAADADDHQRLIGELLCDPLDLGQRLPAWPAPRRPEIQQHHFATHIVPRNLATY